MNPLTWMNLFLDNVSLTIYGPWRDEKKRQNVGCKNFPSGRINMSTKSETGHATMRERAEEVGRLLASISSNIESLGYNENIFVNSMIERYHEFGDGLWVSPQQLFWLRDIADRII